MRIALSRIGAITSHNHKHTILPFGDCQTSDLSTIIRVILATKRATQPRQAGSHKVDYVNYKNIFASFRPKNWPKYPLLQSLAVAKDVPVTGESVRFFETAFG